MHIDHSKLVELLAEAAGISTDNVEKQLAELVAEIKQAIADGDAYEVEGFGIFSGIGNNIIFIPSEELSTEINYKYAGMEPIEMDEDSGSDFGDDEIQTQDTAPETDSGFGEDEDDPFAGLLDDVDESAEMDEEDGEPELDEEETDFDEEPAVEEENLLTDIFEESNTDESREESIVDEIISSEDEELEENEEKPGPEKWGIDSYRDDKDEDRFSGLFGSETAPEGETEPETSDEKTEEEDIFEELKKGREEHNLSIQLDEDAAENEAEAELEADADDDDFDDPFKFASDEISGFEDADEAGEEEITHDDDEEEIVPVIKNISSGSGEKEQEQTTGLKPRTRTSKDRQNSPILLWILLTLILVGGGVYALGYFGVVSIPGIESQKAGNQTQNTTTASLGSQQNDTPETVLNNEQDAAELQDNTTEDARNTDPENSGQEQETIPEVTEPDEVAETGNTEDVSVPDQPLYGLRGTVVDAANKGYTIVIYSLSRQENAQQAQQRLTGEGYRSLIYSVPHAQYGTLYRVSLGQFETLRDAALAAEGLSEPYSENYFITKIQPDN